MPLLQHDLCLLHRDTRSNVRQQLHSKAARTDQQTHIQEHAAMAAAIANGLPNCAGAAGGAATRHRVALVAAAATTALWAACQILLVDDTGANWRLMFCADIPYANAGSCSDATNHRSERTPCPYIFWCEHWCGTYLHMILDPPTLLARHLTVHPQITKLNDCGHRAGLGV